MIYLIKCWFGQKNKGRLATKDSITIFFLFHQKVLLEKYLSFCGESYCLLSISMFPLTLNGSAYRNTRRESN